MKVERLQKLSKEKLIELVLSKQEEIELIEKRLDTQKEVGEIFFKDKIYKVILREVEIANDR